MQTYTHKYIQTYIQMYTHTYIQTYTRTYIHTPTNTYIHTYMHTYITTYIHTNKQTYVRTNIHTYRGTHLSYPSFQVRAGRVGSEQPRAGRGTPIGLYTYMHTCIHIFKCICNMNMYIHVFICICKQPIQSNPEPVEVYIRTCIYSCSCANKLP